MTDYTEEINTARRFGERLRFHLYVHGTRPDGSPDKKGEKWGLKEFAHVVGKTDKTVSNWIKNLKRPPDIFSI